MAPKADQGCNASPEVLASATAALWHKGMCSFLGHSLPKDRQSGSPRRCRTHPNHLSCSSFSVTAFWKKKPHTLLTVLAPSQQAGSATITLTAFLKISSEPEFWLTWHLTSHIKVLTYALFLFLFTPCNISFRCHCFAYFLIQDFDILKALYISYLGNIQRRTTQMGK